MIVRFSAHKGIPEGCFHMIARFSAHKGIPGGYYKFLNASDSRFL